MFSFYIFYSELVKESDGKTETDREPLGERRRISREAAKGTTGWRAGG